VLKELRADETAAPSADFNRSLGDAWRAEVASANVAGTRSRNWWRLVIPLAAAAVIGFVLLWPGGMVNDHGGGGGVAWADVVRAMDRVAYFHVIAFSDDPRRADESMKMFRIDLFYQQPDRWRAHGMGYVAFSTEGKRQTWSVAKRKFTEKGDRAPDLFPGEFVDQFRKAGTLSAVLSSIFDGKVPPGEPVKSDEVSASQGIDVFDYAQNASNKWARIWVLRESKLPLKMHLYYPGSDEFMLVTFDYSDPQPDAFFDADQFAAQARRMQTDDAYRYYSIGSTPVAGTRPRGADQIHAVEGGYKAPQVKRLASNGEGDVLLVTTRVENTTPSGTRPHAAEYERITDTWGNEYLIATQTWGNSERGEHRWWLMPQPPMKQGTGPRRITMTYVVEPRYGERNELATETLDVPAPATQPAAKDWPADLPGQKRSTWRQYLQRVGTLGQQLDEIDRDLAVDAKDISALMWKFRLLRKHGRETQAWVMFEQDLRDRVFGDPKLLNQCYVEASEYLLYLDSSNRTDELRERSTSARKIMEDAQNAKESKHSSQLFNLERAQDNPLYPASHVLEWRETYKAGPEVVRTIAGRDGLVFVELSIPKPPEGWNSNGWDGSAPYGWFWQPTFGKQWQTNARLAKADDNRLWLVLRGEGKQISLAGEALLALDNYGTKPVRHDAKLAWQRTIDVPEPTIDDIKVWWTKEAGNQGWWPLPPANAQLPVVAQADGVEHWMTMAKTYRDAARYDQALPLYEKVIALPKEQWPAMYTQGVGLLEDTVEMTKRQMRIGQAQCLAELGRLDDARKVAAEMWATLPTPPDLSEPLDGHIAADAVIADIQVARALAKRGQVAAAKAELDRIATRRPKITDIRDGTIMVDRGVAKMGWHPRSKQQDAWREFDSVWWDVKEARGN
jgi:tetratricopeptide (TPR) repeat protein